MGNPLELSVLIPTYNERDIVSHALVEIETALGALAKQTEIIIVDDGTDDLPEVVSKSKSKLSFQNVEVIRNHPPLGKGRSLVSGFQRAQAPVVGFLDVDLSTPPSYILKAFTSIKSGQSDIFIGSRKASGSEVTREQFWLKDILGHVLGYLARGVIFFRMRAYADTQCGFKFYRNDVAKTLYRDLVAPDGLNDLEILLRANLLKMRVQECGVVWTDLRESKRTLRRILVGELIAMCRILWTYKIQASQSRKRLATSK
ncbi:MAG: glycosyltransferase [Oligoflexia bacterium]|nr:glycosyltransferase [Oligoflexia bacterium]